MLLACCAAIVHAACVGHHQHIPDEVAAARYPVVLFNSFDVMPGRLGTDSSPAIEIPKEMSAPPSAEDDLTAVFSLASQMRTLIQETLASSTVAGWEDAFFKRLRTYETFSEALGEMLTRVKLPGTDRKRNRERVERSLAKRFPDALGEIRFIARVVEDASEHALGFSSSPVANELRAEDSMNANRFTAYGAVFNMCLTTLYYIARHAPSTPDEIANAVLELARHAALEFNDAAMEGARLRDSQETKEAAAEPDDRVAVQIERAYPGGDDLEHVEEIIRRVERGAGPVVA